MPASASFGASWLRSSLAASAGESVSELNVEISVDTESEFNICLPEKNILQTAEEIFGQGVLQKDGILTEDGKRLLLRRMPDLAPEQLQGAVKVSDLRRLFGKVSIWVRMIHGLMGYTPLACPDCGSSGLEPAVGSRLKCLQCGKECDIPSGEQLNRRWIQEYYEKEYLPIQDALRTRGVTQPA